ncbi:hypothetical protein MKQ68_14700 [Chitinophaga horti]|uniref:Uncharacterized protein n=1 Tax=Chitinophaga horti TaxID=2920382 RepID=A0ABY6IVE0_9BACT|nr:hypothetical protein [Chitinophaga horti]UYQ91340.1 hypothetical protein MKQ68_14700 [Chitinophaga horti]
MFLCGINAVVEPKQPHALQERVNHLQDRFLEAKSQQGIVKHLFKSLLVKVDHGFYQLVAKGLEQIFGNLFFQRAVADLVFRHLRDLGNFNTAVVQVRYAHNVFKIVVVVHPVICILTLRLQQVIALLPHPDGVGFDAGEQFNIFYGKTVQSNTCRIKQKYNLRS